MGLHQFNLNCPKCKKSLMDAYRTVDEQPSIRLTIRIAGKEGTIRLSSLYGSYEYISDIETPEGELAEFICPACHEVLNTDYQCDVCDAPMVEFKVAEGGKAVICSRSGCKNHNVGYKDLASTLNQFYKRHQYGDRVDS